jgi:hypothetical protein
MLTTAAKVFGVVFLVIGVLGFVPQATPDHMLLGVFHVNAFHNLVHIASGAIALFAASRGPRAAQTYFRVFGIVYGLVAVLGFFEGEGEILGVLANNMADVWLHVGIAALSLLLGFGVRAEDAPAAGGRAATP